MRCGYPASSIRERIYVDPQGGRYGILLYTGSPDAEGTLGHAGELESVAAGLAELERLGITGRARRGAARQGGRGG